MKAIVLTYDHNAIITEHMIHCYNELWPNHPFTFRIPYQHDERLILSAQREYVKTSPEIKATVLSLLEDLDDEEWVYWCIDDKYPIKLQIDKIVTIYKSLLNSKLNNLSAVLFCRARKMLNPDYLTGETVLLDDEEIIERKAYHQIWIHQFLKVKVIRFLFLNFPYIERPRIMDTLKHLIEKPNGHKLFVTSINRSVFGESTFDGVITANCCESMVAKGMKIPECFVVNPQKCTIIGDL